MSFKQSRFYHTPVLFYRNLHVTDSKKVTEDYVLDVDNLNESIDGFKKYMNVKNALFLTGHKESSKKLNENSLSLAASLAVYLEDEITFIDDVYILKLDDIEDITLTGKSDSGLMSFIGNELQISLSGYNGAILKLKNKLEEKKIKSYTKVSTKKATQKIKNV